MSHLVSELMMTLCCLFNCPVSATAAAAAAEVVVKPKLSDDQCSQSSVANVPPDIAAYAEAVRRTSAGMYLRRQSGKVPPRLTLCDAQYWTII